MKNNTPNCYDCCHIEVCSYALPVASIVSLAVEYLPQLIPTRGKRKENRMDEKLIASPRANGKSMLCLAKALGTICSIAFGISEAEGFKMALEAIMESKEEKE